MNLSFGLKTYKLKYEMEVGPGLPDFSLYKIGTKTGKYIKNDQQTYQMAIGKI
jgi:hypothetical protein